MKKVILIVTLLVLGAFGISVAQSVAMPLEPGRYEFYCGTGRLRHTFIDGNVNYVRLTCTTNGEGVVQPTATPVPPTATPVQPTPTPVSGGATVPNWLENVGMTGEFGMSPQTFQKIVADAASGEFNRACEPSEHDANQWHTLLNYADDNQPGGPCHFSHQHGDNPFAVNDLFGPVSQSFGVENSISYPWETYVADSNGNAVLDADGTFKWENEYKHAGYTWAVRRNQCANGDPSYCVDAFRIQYHASAMGNATRWHSYSAEIRVCRDGNNPSTCSNAQVGGWIDTFALFTPTYENSTPGLCDNAFNSAYFGSGENINDFGLSNQFVPRNDPDLQDEQRCHRRLTADMVTNYPNGLPYSASAPAEWWHHTPWDFRFNVMFFNPIGEPDGQGGTNIYCDSNDTNCRWTSGRRTLNVDYVFPVMSWHDGFVGWVDRFGNYGNGCSAAALDCIWTDYSQVQRNPNALGYVHTSDLERSGGNGTVPFNYDITPSNNVSWINWFRGTMQ